jgi:hypothetical protein
MKKILIIIFAMSMAFGTYSQDNRGLDNQFYFRLGYSKPANSYLGADKDYWQDISRSGWMFELGSIFMINNLALADGLRLGVNVDYIDISYHQFKYDINDLAVRFVKLSSKVGPSLSYNPVSKLVFDVYLKAKIPWVAGLWVDEPDLNIEDEEVYSGAMGFGYSAGFNVRYSILIIGFEFTSDNMKLNNVDDSEDYLGNIGEEGDKSKLANFNFTVGLSF